jgi:hypothetical protein
MKSFISRFFLVAAVLAIGFGSATGQDADLAKLEAVFSEAISRAEQPVVELKGQYVKGLEKYLEAAQQRGDLEGVLAGKKEIETFAQKDRQDVSRWPDLKRMREIYDTSLTRVAGEVAVARLKIYETYRKELQTRVENLTRQGKLEEAVKLAERVKGLGQHSDTDKKEPPKTPTGAVLWEFKQLADLELVNDCEIRSADGKSFTISSARESGSFVQSKGVTFKPPFRIQARVATDSTNIRFIFAGKQMVIFNWEAKPSELRIHDPDSGKGFSVQDIRELRAGRLYDIEIDVLTDKLVIRSNGIKVAEPQVNCRATEGPIGIGPAFGSVLTLESLSVSPIK